jgi:hypothetical protein
MTSIHIPFRISWKHVLQLNIWLQSPKIQHQYQSLTSRCRLPPSSEPISLLPIVMPLFHLFLYLPSGHFLTGYSLQVFLPMAITYAVFHSPDNTRHIYTTLFIVGNTFHFSLNISKLLLCWIWGSHGGQDVCGCFLGCVAICTCKRVRTFRRNIPPLSSETQNTAMDDCVIDSEDAVKFASSVNGVPNEMGN